MTTRTSVERIDDPAAFERLEGGWRELLSASGADSLFLTWEWLFTWWKHLAGRRRLAILAVRASGELIALAPLAARAPGLARGLPVPSLELLGTGSVGSDYLDLIVRRERVADAVSALAAYLADGVAMVGLPQVRAEASHGRDLAAALERRGWSLRRRQTSVCPFIDLAGRSWESYLDDLGPAHRYNFRRRLRQLERRGDLRFERVETEAQRARAFSELVTLHQSRWLSRGGSNALDSPALVAFHEDLSRLALARGWLRLFTLRLDDTALAGVYGFRYRDTFYFYQSGFDPRWSPLSAGLVALGLSIKAAADEGVPVYDLLHGDEAYKFQWARQTRELERLELYPPRVRGWLYRQAIDANRRARRVARRVLPEPVAQRLAVGLGSGG